MNTKLLLFNILTLLALAVVILRGQGAGPLDPPAAPADGVYRTLEEIYLAAKGTESRTPIDSLPFVISQSGSYYLRSNLHFNEPFGHAIRIAAHNVTIDLNGFTLSSSAAVTGRAIDLGPVLSPYSRIVIRNGFIQGTTVVPADNPSDPIEPGGFEDGIASLTTAPGDLGNRVEDLTVTGCRRYGLCLGPGSVIERCTIRQCGSSGVFCRGGTVRNSTASYCGIVGIIAGTVTDCEASFNCASGIGQAASTRTNLAKGCRAVGNREIGIIADLIVNCSAISNITDGLSSNNAGGDGVISGSFSSANGGAAISTTGTRTGNFPAP